MYVKLDLQAQNVLSVNIPFGEPIVCFIMWAK